MIKEILEDAAERMQGAIDVLNKDLSGYRTGRASTGLVEGLKVEMYGSELPLNQIASASVPEPQQIAIRPYDANAIGAIERAILKSDLGLNPNNDGKIIRLNLPMLTEDRRRDLSKQVGKRVEDAKVAVRNVRRDALNDIRDAENDKLVSEDESRNGQDKLQELTDVFTKRVDELGATKKKEIMEV
ncbi:MAG: ribosome recycling factor [Anaerolineales bacterium]|nr:ribosome recycling factor [Anaerolineales bacterium]